MIRFNEKITSLKAESKNTFPALTVEKNPVVLSIDKLSFNQNKRIIEQYSIFSNEAIHMLLDGMIRTYKWPIFFREIQENIEEEMGKYTNSVPHLEIMRVGYSQELGIDTENLVPIRETELFISRMRKIFRSKDLPFLCGALIAFEGIAIEEFEILDKIIIGFCKKGEISLDSLDLTRSYIDGHKDFEIGHESHLIESASSYIEENNFEHVRDGYMNLCMIISNWWINLEKEIKRSES